MTKLKLKRMDWKMPTFPAKCEHCYKENAKGFFNQIVVLMADLDGKIGEMEEFIGAQELAVTQTSERAQNVAGLAHEITSSTKKQLATAAEMKELMANANVIYSENVAEIDAADEILLNFMERIQFLMDAVRKFKVSSEKDQSKDVESNLGEQSGSGELEDRTEEALVQ